MLSSFLHFSTAKIYTAVAMNCDTPVAAVGDNRPPVAAISSKSPYHLSGKA